MNRLISFISVAIIIFTVVPFIYSTNPSYTKTISFLTLASSIAVLVITNLQYGNNDLVNSEQFHRCGLEINEIARELDHEVAKDVLFDEKPFADRYSAVLQKYSVNHDDVDYYKHKIDRFSESGMEFSGFRGSIKYWSWTTAVLFSRVAIAIYVIFSVLMVWALVVFVTRVLVTEG